MDQQTAEVITIAIEQQKQNEKELAEQQQAQLQTPDQNNQSETNHIDQITATTNDEEILQLAEQVHGRVANEGLFELSEEAKQAVKIQQGHDTNGVTEPGELPRASAHKTFAVDPSLNVGVGLVSGIIGPKIHAQSDLVAAPSGDHPSCSRCKKIFHVELDGIIYKLCHHCRALQRQRSRRWQQKIKEKEGSCRRCGTDMLEQDRKYVLCAHCRLNLRTRKASRYETGKCVHCAGVNDSQYKVCARCRDNDKQRRKKLEAEGRCNRCASVLKDADAGHKVCFDCRNKKRKLGGKLGGSTDAVTAAAAATAHRQVQSIHGSIHDLRTQIQPSEPPVVDSNQIYQQQVAQQLEANIFASRNGQQVQHAQQQSQQHQEQQQLSVIVPVATGPQQGNN